jgi:hypothetical protein
MIEIAGATQEAQELVHPRTEAPRAPAGEVTDLRRTCLAVLRAEWSSLALVDADAGAAGELVAAQLTELAHAYRLRPVRVLPGSGVSAPQIALLQDELAAARRGGEARVVVTLGNPRADPASVPLLVHADAAVLVVRLGASELGTIEEIVGLVGRERIIGCVVAR